MASPCTSGDGVTTDCAIPDGLFSMFGTEVSMSSSCTYGTCLSWSPMGPGGYGYSGHFSTEKGKRYVIVIVDCFSRWTEACPLE